MSGTLELKQVAEPLYRVKGWMKLAGVMSIIQGVLSILSIWGILICWIPIWLGVLLCRASNRLRAAYEMDDANELEQSVKGLATYFRLYGVLMLVMLVVSSLAIAAAIVLPVLVKARQAAAGL